MLPRRIVLELLMTAAPISAARAYDLGLVNEVVPAAALVERTQALAERIAANAPLSVRAAKAMVDVIDPSRTSEAFDLAEAIWQPVYTSADAQEGPKAFAERRTPNWQGR